MSPNRGHQEDGAAGHPRAFAVSKRFGILHRLAPVSNADVFVLRVEIFGLGASFDGRLRENDLFHCGAQVG